MKGSTEDTVEIKNWRRKEFGITVHYIVNGQEIRDDIDFDEVQDIVVTYNNGFARLEFRYDGQTKIFNLKDENQKLQKHYNHLMSQVSIFQYILGFVPMYLM